MQLNQLLSTLFLLSLTFGCFADAFDELEAETYERGNATKTHIEMDNEFGGCMKERQEHKQRIGKMQDTLKSKTNKIAKLETKVDSLGAKLNKRQKPKICNTSELAQKLEKLHARNAKLKSINGRLTDDLLALKTSRTYKAESNQAALLAAQQENLKLQEQIAQLQNEPIRNTPKGPAIKPKQHLPLATNWVDAEPVDADWNWTATKFQNYVGQNFAYTCPPDGTIHSVWGTDNYRFSSSVCSAAVHAGLITKEVGGTATIKIAKYSKKYKNSYHNGVGSQAYGNGNGFIFLTQSKVKQAPIRPVVSTDMGEVKLLKVTKVNASSTRGKAHASFVNDGNPATSWQSSNKVTSAQSIKLSFDKTEILSRFYISIPEYKFGFPPKSVTLYFSDGSSQVFAMNNKWGKQRFSLNPVKTSSVEVEIGDMHKPSPHNVYAFLQVSEIELYGH